MIRSRCRSVAVALMLGAAGCGGGCVGASCAGADRGLGPQLRYSGSRAARHGNEYRCTGNLVAPDTPGSFVATGQKFSGEEVRRALSGQTLPGTTYEQSQAYVNYIRRLQAGQSGFTCFASLQMPR
jgi:hypothetical protein